MGYRDDREALRLEIAHLESENERLRQELSRVEARYEDVVQNAHEDRRDASRDRCVMCGGSLLPVAVFAGRDGRKPVPLHVSTMRFGSPEGGFTHTGSFQSMACSSCGFLHSFLAFEDKSKKLKAL